MMSLEAQRLFVAAAVIAGYLLFCWLIFLHHRRKRREAQRHAVALSESTSGQPPVLVAYASQTGYAEQLAWQTADTLRAGGLTVRVASIAEIDGDLLETFERAFFAVSTTGEGDAPDSAVRFSRKMAESGRLNALHYGLLALGDRTYKDYCAFGRALDQWLRHSGAVPLFDRVEVDNCDEGALRHWQHNLGMVTGRTDLADWTPPAYGRWRLVERRLLNAGSPGGPAFHIALEPLDGAEQWQAGDIAEIGPKNSAQDVEALLLELGLDAGAHVARGGRRMSMRQVLEDAFLPCSAQEREALRNLSAQDIADRLKPLPHREYSIASLPADGRLELLVRQMTQADGRLGLGSGWLTQYAPLGGEVALRIRENRAFHPPKNGAPLILIGNGTGMAGLRAHLRFRAKSGLHRNWLLFGERTAQYDYFHREEIELWRERGVLERVDLVFSRDQPERTYVQHRLSAASAAIRDWVDGGAFIYVCGSLQGMAEGVGQVLEETLGREQLELLAEQGRYRRDVY